MAEPVSTLGTVGVGAGNSSSTLNGMAFPLVLGPNQDQLVSQLHGEFYEQSRRSNSFFAAIVGQTTTVGLATTYTGLCLSNPVGSGRLVIVDRVGISFSVAFAAASAVGLMVGYNATTNVTHTAAVTVRQSRIGGQLATPAAVGLVDSSATLPTAPVVHSILGVGLTGAITTTPAIEPGYVDVKGQIVLEPGAYVAVYTSTASGASGLNASIAWHEQYL